jgi:peptidoglycan/xylan/chitin deacetylase (PgdA/CDA1 family)
MEMDIAYVSGLEKHRPKVGYHKQVPYRFGKYLCKSSLEDQQFDCNLCVVFSEPELPEWIMFFSLSESAFSSSAQAKLDKPSHGINFVHRFLLAMGAVAVFTALSVSSQASDMASCAPTVILKLDDLRRPSPAWKRTLEFLRSRNIKSSVGIICDSLEAGQPYEYNWFKEIAQTGLVEFWNHGWDHKQWKENGQDVMEFKGTPYAQQKEHLLRSQQLAKEKLGITFRTFGAPFNAVDEATLKAMNEIPELKVFLYGTPGQAAAIPNMLIIERTQMNIEYPIFVPNPERIEHDYKALAGKWKCFAIQGHPDNWDDARFAKFQQVIDYLISQGVTFSTPYEYFLSKHPEAKR